ncbi:MAG TPA: hypothetical protein VFQ39_18820 [Longimicrobium sp.]|nr:hypothetical protein [Longimicrobium sp.]
MRKLRLDVETLAIESFPTTREESGRRGTVRGAANTNPYTLVIADTGVTCTNWPSYGMNLCDPTHTGCVVVGEPEYQTVVGGSC